jgi:CheY-like chemotaxis protein
VMMPEIDGWQVVGQLRRNPKTSHIPVVICTIIAQEDLAYSLGASAYLRKPVTREMLVATLDRLAGSAAPGSG